MPKLIPGAIVRLKIGGYAMRIKSVAANVMTDGGFIVLCEWHDTNGHLKSDSFHAGELETLHPARNEPIANESDTLRANGASPAPSALSR